MPGYYLAPGTPVLKLRGGSAALDPRLVRRVLVLSRQRNMDQDPGFALRRFVDIAIRGLSPAVNDPTTAVQALDRIETLLADLHGRRPGPSLVTDDDGVPRGLVAAPNWEEYLELGLIEIRHYGAGSAQIARRLRALYAHLLEIVDDDERPRVALEQRLLDEELVRSFPDPAEREILGRPDPLGLASAP